MSFHEALATQPDWVRLWVLWLNVASVGTLAVLLLARATWGIAATLLAVNVAMVISMINLHAAVGFVRLLGLPHLVFWTPLVAWLVLRLRQGPALPRAQAAALWVLVATYTVSLGFDAADVARYLAGERESMVPEHLRAGPAG